jgi:hypothetical protein
MFPFDEFIAQAESDGYSAAEFDHGGQVGLSNGIRAVREKVSQDWREQYDQMKAAIDD